MQSGTRFLLVLVLFIFLAGCNGVESRKKAGLYKTHQVERAVKSPQIDGKWFGPVWDRVKPLDVAEYVNEKPEHMPKTQAKLLYDDEFVYVIFRVEDRYVRAVAQKYHDHVYRDSCVEFFFIPSQNLAEGYFNIEINCGGTMLFHHQTAIRENTVVVETADCDKVKIYHCLPKIVEPEITEPTTWLIEYRIPLEVLEKYATVQRPAPGVTWRANFYKCGARTSHPHALTWSLIDYPKPKFHLPQFFGTLEFK